MNAHGWFHDNIFIERLRRSLKYELIYLREFESGKELRSVLFPMVQALQQGTVSSGFWVQDSMKFTNSTRQHKMPGSEGEQKSRNRLSKK